MGVVEPEFLEQLDTSGISRFEAALYDWLESDSINSYLRSLRAFANWSARVFDGYSAPAFSIDRAKAGGRPLSAEEVEKMLAHCLDVVGERCAGSWRFLIRGLVRSGLRLGQALALSWDPDAPIRVYGMDRRPKFFIASDSHKGKRTQHISLTPPMVSLLRRVPPDRRAGYVFRPRLKKGVTRSLVTVSATICRVGQAADIRIGTRMKRDQQTREVTRAPKFASAHDLKRTFMQRLIALNIHPAIVAHYGQHQSFETTQRHYAEHDADRLGALVNDAFRKRRKRATKR